MGLSISVQTITKEFKGDGIKTLALDHVSVDFQEGEFVSIVRTSGSGTITVKRRSITKVSTLCFITLNLKPISSIF